MLNTKKNLLHRVRIMMVAIVTILGIGSAFAMNAPHHRAVMTYGVVATVSGGYHVTSATAGDCDNAPNTTCTLQSTATPDANGFIPNSSVVANSKVPGRFIQ